MPLPRGGFCSFSPDDNKLAFNRVFREFRTWKRYRGGMADDVWVYDFETKKTENNHQLRMRRNIIPMWSGNKIYFLSDRDEKKRMNLYVYDLTDKTTRQLTNFTDFDIKFPSLGERQSSSRTAAGFIAAISATEKSEKSADPHSRRSCLRARRTHQRQQECHQL